MSRRSKNSPKQSLEALKGWMRQYKINQKVDAPVVVEKERKPVDNRELLVKEAV